MASGFRLGDVVQLKSGGYRMTVNETERDKSAVRCIWFDEHGGFHEAKISIAALRGSEPWTKPAK